MSVYSLFCCCQQNQLGFLFFYKLIKHRLVHLGGFHYCSLEADHVVCVCVFIYCVYICIIFYVLHLFLCDVFSGQHV